MEYKDMPLSWLDFYKNGFRYAGKNLGIDLSEEDVEKSFEVLKEFNPRLHYREIDYSPEVIFEKATMHWKGEFSVAEVIDAFYQSMGLRGYIYPETVPFLDKLKAYGYLIAAFTDVAIGMPDELHRSFFPELIPYFDKYVSSLSCGYRKPNPKGIEEIAVHFGVSANEMVMIGDEEKDIKTAKRFGIMSVYIDRNNTGNDFGQDYTVENLNDFLSVLEAI